MAKRKFAAEGCLNLYSSEANPLYPSELYSVDHLSGLRDALTMCNLYMITTRRRIFVDPDSLAVTNKTIIGHLLVADDGKWKPIPFCYSLVEAQLDHLGTPVHIETNEAGSYVHIRGTRNPITIPTYAIVATSDCELGAHSDLDVLYVGQGIGRTRQRLAVDRLMAHDTFQQILADAVTHAPSHEVIILMFRFEHAQIFVSSGGDLTLDPSASIEDERHHFRAMTDGTLLQKIDRKQRISLAEAALIQHFQPRYNRTLKHSNFTAKKRLKLLQMLDRLDLTGLVVEVCTANIRSRLRSASCSPAGVMEDMPNELDLTKLGSEAKTWRHTHIAKLPLTNADERNTFLHGTRWR